MNIHEFNDRIKLSETKGISFLFEKRSHVFLNEFGFYDEIIEGLPTDNVSKSTCDSYTIFNSSKIINISHDLYSQLPSIQYDNKIGYFYDLFAGYSIEGEFRANGSSGGLTTWITSELFKTKQISHLIHVKKGTNGILFQYGISRSIDDIKSNSKTRYYPVELSEILDFVSKNEGQYAIVGIPDIISSVRLLSNIYPVFKERIKFYIGLICGHQKSTKFLESMVKQAGLKVEDVIDFDFRHKIPTNRADQYGIKIITNSKSVVIEKNILFGQNWGQGLFKLESSDFTDDVFNELADITLGDAWLERFSKDPKGTNVVIIRNPIIRELFIKGIKEGRICLESLSLNEVFQSQKSHYIHTHDELGYRLYLREKANKWVPMKRVNPSNKLSFTRKKIQKNRALISLFSHSLYLTNESRPINVYMSKMRRLTKNYENIYKFLRFQKILKNFIDNRIIKKFKRNAKEINNLT